MSARIRYLALTAARTRAPLPPLAATLLVLLGVYAFRPNEVGATYGLTALVACALATWLAGAVLAGEPEPQAAMATVALGGRRGREALDRALVAVVAALLCALFVAYPLLLGLAVDDVFDRAVRLGDVVAATLAHLATAGLGAAVGVVYAPPRIARPATAAAAAAATLLALAGPLPAVAGPLAVASALTDGGSLLAPASSCVALAVLALVVAARWGRRAG